MHAQEETDDKAEQHRKQKREEKGARSFLDVSPERRGRQQVGEIAEGLDRRGHGLAAGEFEQELPRGE